MYNQLLTFLYSKSNKILSDNIERINSNFERADKIIIWLVGFSIGTFVLLFGNETKLENPNFKIIKEISDYLILISLMVTILGLLFRVCSFFAQYFLNQVFMNFLSFTDSQTSFPQLPIIRKITDTDSIEDILYYLELDYNYKREKLEFNDYKQKEGYRQALKDFYNSIAESNDEEKQLKTFWYTYAEYFGKSKKKAEKLMKNEANVKIDGIIYRVLYTLSLLFFFLTITTFITGIIMILLKFLSNNCS